MPSSTSRILFILIISQFCGTSLWFAGNAILPLLQSLYQWKTESLGYLTSSIQFGFILGTLTLALIGIADKFSPSKIFFASSMAAAVSNAIGLFDLSSFPLLLTSRFMTGFSLAGIYPVGMKIAADWREQGLGNWLGFLVGALTIGTSFPHALKLFPGFIKPETITIAVSALAALGGVMVLFFIPNGPFRKPALKFSFMDVREIFKQPDFRAAAFGYFGHMWELYAFWAFVPWALVSYQTFSNTHFNISFWSFVIIASGSLGCVIGGQLSFKFGSKRMAAIALISSGICCLLSPFLFNLPPELFFVMMIFWGVMVIADSPQFSALVAFHAPSHIRGSAITITTCIGFAITIFSIQLLNFLQGRIDTLYLLFLLSPGPVFGVVCLYKARFDKI